MLSGAEEVAQWLKYLPSKGKDLRSIPRIHINYIVGMVTCL